MTWLLMASAAWAACTEPVPLETFRGGVQTAWEHASAQRSTELRAVMAGLQADIECLAQPLAPADAAAFHRNRALVSAQAGDPDGARASAGAVQRLAPDQAAAWAEGSPAFASLLAEAIPAGPAQEFSIALATTVVVDGTEATARTRAHPAVVQVFGPDGEPVGGAWLDARATLPDWVSFPEVDCPAIVPIDDLVSAVDAADQAFTRLDVDAFQAALRTVAVGLPCVDGAIAPSQAAAIHRLEGLRLFTLGAELGTVRSFQESRLLDPTYSPPDAVMPPDSTLRSLWASAGSLGAPPWLPMNTPPTLTMRVDGIAAAERPATLPAIVQATTATGRVVWTRYVPPTAAMPDLSGFVALAEAEQQQQLPPAIALYRAEEARRARDTGRLALGLTGVGLVTVSSFLYLTHARQIGDFYDPATDPDRLADLYKASNTTATLSAVSLVAGAGCITFAIVFQ